MTRIVCEASHQRGNFHLNVRFDSPGPGLTAICGRSGAGKTSLLRIIAGLERPGSGRLVVDDECWLDTANGTFVPAHRRGIGYVTQDSNLFPHLSVRRNLEYGLGRTPARERRISPEEVVAALGLQALLGRGISALSGGERQRVAIGRALLRSPKILLLDEPVSALDLASRGEVLGYLRDVLARLRVRCLYVSHELSEVARLASEMIWLESGHVAAQGPTREVLTDLSLPVARLDDAESLLEAVVEEHEPSLHLTRLRRGSTPLWVPLLEASIGARVWVQIAARDVALAGARPVDLSVLNLLPATVDGLIASPAHPGQVLVRLISEGVPLLARITRKSADSLAVAPGRELWALVKSVAILE